MGRTFSMLRSAAIFVCRSRVFASLVATVRLSSAAVLPMLVMLRLMRSGDWTMRERVRLIVSVTVAISVVTFSCSTVYNAPQQVRENAHNQ